MHASQPNDNLPALVGSPSMCVCSISEVSIYVCVLTIPDYHGSNKRVPKTLCVGFPCMLCVWQASYIRTQEEVAAL